MYRLTFSGVRRFVHQLPIEHLGVKLLFDVYSADSISYFSALIVLKVYHAVGKAYNPRHRWFRIGEWSNAFMFMVNGHIPHKVIEPLVTLRDLESHVIRLEKPTNAPYNWYGELVAATVLLTHEVNINEIDLKATIHNALGNIDSHLFSSISKLLNKPLRVADMKASDFTDVLNIDEEVDLHTESTYIDYANTGSDAISIDDIREYDEIIDSICSITLTDIQMC